jgi:fructose-1,6-bisphosphatase/inositol monophosphatase family enzyme
MFIKIKNIIQKNLKIKNIKIKKDGSFLTNNDVVIEKKLKKNFSKNFKNINYISEETGKIKQNINISEPTIIIDPIDGTENFIFLKKNYGTAISILNIYKNNRHFLFLPKENILINNINLNSISKKPNKKNRINLFSTNCFNIKNDFDKHSRFYGSNTYSFVNFIIGNCRSFQNCSGAKIWDCYTGLSLCNMIKSCKIEIPGLTINNWLKKPSFLTRFKVSWL